MVDVHEIATIMTDDEFQRFLEGFQEKAALDELKNYTSRVCAVASEICDHDENLHFSVAQIRRLFDLAK